jgi:elongation factor G
MEDRSTFPPSLIEVAVEVRNRRDHDRLLLALGRLDATDPAFSVTVDPDSGQIVLGGTSEPHLDAKVHALRTVDGIDLRNGAPQIAYRETIGRPATIDYTHAKLSGERGQFARVLIAFEPLDIAEDFTFVNAVSDGRIPDDFIPGVEKGLRLQSESGLLAGFPLIGVKATLLDGAYHDMDSSPLTFEIAARAALRELAQKSSPILLQPIMSVDIEAPLDVIGSVTKDADQRGTVLEMTAGQDETMLIKAEAPLANLFGYVNALNQMTEGRGKYTMAFARYAQVPLNPADPDDDPRFPPAMGARAVRLDIA